MLRIVQIFKAFTKKHSSGREKTRAVNNMSTWIESKNGFGKWPEKIEIVAEKKLYWPTQKYENCYLLKFVIDKKEYVGFTGPATWAFKHVSYSGLTVNSLFARYTGWFIAEVYQKSSQYDPELEGLDKAQVLDALLKQGYTGMQVLQNIAPGKINYYMISCMKDNAPVIIAGTAGELHAFSPGHVLPLYEFIGVKWNPFKLI